MGAEIGVAAVFAACLSDASTAGRADGSIFVALSSGCAGCRFLAREGADRTVHFIRGMRMRAPIRLLSRIRASFGCFRVMYKQIAGGAAGPPWMRYRRHPGVFALVAAAAANAVAVGSVLAGLAGSVLTAPPAAAATSATTIAAGVSHSCTIQSGKAYCWGDNTYGELGNGTTTSSSVPVPVSTSGVLARVTLTQIVAGNQFTCARGSGTVYCWGLNSSGQLGDGTTANSAVPVEVTGVAANGLTAGYDFACMHDALSGSAYCWGDNTDGQLGNGTSTSSRSPVAVKNSSGALNGKIVTAVTAGSYHACALDSGGNVYCWGDNGSGQLGNASTANSSVPVKLSNSGAISGSTVLSQIEAGGDHTCAVDNAGKAYCWGQNNYGELGNNSATDSSVPVSISTGGNGGLTAGTVTQITSGYYHTCALAGGLAYCWGYGAFGQRGDNFSLIATKPTPVAVVTSGVLSGKTLTQITGGASHTCAIDSTGVVYCWGLGSSGQLGDNSSTSKQAPVHVLPAVPVTLRALPGTPALSGQG